MVLLEEFGKLSGYRVNIVDVLMPVDSNKDGMSLNLLLFKISPPKIQIPWNDNNSDAK